MKKSLPLLVFPLLKLVLHLATFRGYGWFRDELYYLACADHLAWGYVDHPPLSIFLLWIVRSALGDSLLAVRLLPAFAGAVTVLLVGLLARRLGGGTAAQSVSMLATVVAPIYLALNHFFSMNAFDVLLWALAAYILVLLLEQDEPQTLHLWALLGLVLGLGLLDKISVLWLGLGLLIGLLATDRRRLLLTPGPWLAGGIAALLFVPHLLWQVTHDWPTLEFIRNATQTKMVQVAALELLRSQLMMTNPVAVPLWLAGLAWLLFGKQGRRYRALGMIYLTVLIVLVVNGASRAGYLAPAYTWLLPAGAVALDALIGHRRGGAAWWWGYSGILLVSGSLLSPFALPVLPVESYVMYARTAGVEASTEERKELAELPQFYADMHGWQSIVDTVAEVFHSLPSEEQEQAAIFTPNYGDAGAIDLLGRRLGLPSAISGHNSYWLWGPGPHSGEVVLVMGSEKEDLEELFAQVELGAVIDCGYCMPYENNRPVWISRDMTTSLAELWPRLKHFD